MPPPTNAKSTRRFMRSHVPHVPSVHTTDEPFEIHRSVCWRSPKIEIASGYHAYGGQASPEEMGASARGAAGSRLARDLVARDEGGIHLLEHDLAVDHALADVGAAR